MVFSQTHSNSLSVCQSLNESDTDLIFLTFELSFVFRKIIGELPFNYEKQENRSQKLVEA
jgi:hypothetical protein